MHQLLGRATGVAHSDKTGNQTRRPFLPLCVVFRIARC